MASLLPKTAASVSVGQRMWNALSAWCIKNSGYQKLGLRRDDLYDEVNWPDVKEAIRRLPENEVNLRHYRLKRAFDLSVKHSILPKDQWTTPEEDIRYLGPYLKGVIEEMKEREKWSTQ